MDKPFISELVPMGILVLAILVLAGGTSQSAPLSINFTAISETIVSANPIAALIASVLTSIIVLAKLYGKIKGYFERRSWNKKYGKPRTPVVIDASNS